MKSINTFADHAPKPEWVQAFFDHGNAFFESHTLGPMQISMFKRFLSDAELIAKNRVTHFFELLKTIGFESDTAWGLIYIQLAYGNPQIRWYIDNMPMDTICIRAELEDRLMAEGLSAKDAKSAVKAFKRLCEIPLGVTMHFGTTAGKALDTLMRTTCNMSNDRVLLYALYRYAEECRDYHEFSLARLMDTTIESGGISPVKLFGSTCDDMEAMLSGLSSKYPDFINVTFTHGLDKVVLREEKTSDDVLALFE